MENCYIIKCVTCDPSKESTSYASTSYNNSPERDRQLSKKINLNGIFRFAGYEFRQNKRYNQMITFSNCG